MNYKKLNEEIEEVLNPNYIEEYTTDQMINGYRVQTDFNYNSACGVLVDNDKFGLAWDQYDNAIYYGTSPEDESYIPLPNNQRLVPTKEDLEKAVSQINLPQGFPTDLFYEKVLEIGKDINNNYDAYWEDWHSKYDRKNESEEPIIQD